MKSLFFLVSATILLSSCKSNDQKSDQKKTREME